MYIFLSLPTAVTFFRPLICWDIGFIPTFLRPPERVATKRDPKHPSYTRLYGLANT